MSRPAPARSHSSRPQNPPPTGVDNSDAARRKSDPTTVDEWKKQVNDVLWRKVDVPGKQVDNTRTKRLKNLLGSNLTDELADKSRGADDFETALNELIFKFIDDYSDAETDLIGPFINSKAFKWDARQGDYGSTVLHQAVDKGRGKIADKLASRHRAAVDARDYLGRTPLHNACSDPELAAILLRNGSSTDVYDNQHITPLHMAALKPDDMGDKEQAAKDSKNQAEVVKYLLDYGAEVNTRDFFGDSPLHEAAKTSNLAIMRLLVEGGADTAIVNFDNKTPRDVLPGNLDQEILNLLEQPTKKQKRATFRAIPTNAPSCWSSTSSDAQSETGSSSTSDTNRDVCRCFFANVRFFYRKEPFSWAYPISIHNLLRHDKDAENEKPPNEKPRDKRMEDLETEFVNLVLKKFGNEDKVTDVSIRANIWRWIHIPANQMSWVTDLVWCLTDQPKPPSERQEAWKFLERNISQQSGVKHGLFTRVPHARDMLKNLQDTGPAPAAGGTALDADPNRSDETNSSKKGPAGDILKSPHDAGPAPAAGDTASDPNLNKPNNKKSAKGVKDTSKASTSIQTPRLCRRETWRNTTNVSESQRLSVVIPFIDFETEQYLQRHEKDKDGKYKIKTLRFLDKHILEEMSFPYEGLRGLHKPETLDRFHYEMLSEDHLSARDNDQVVYKWFQHRERDRKDDSERDSSKSVSEVDRTKTVARPSPGRNMGSKSLKPPAKTLKSKHTGETSSGGSPVDVSRLPRLLMVHQLWLWRLDKDTVITAFPERYHQGVEDSLFETIRQSDIDAYKKPEQLIESILFECVMFPEEFRLAGLGLHVLDIFQSSIARTSNEEVIHFKSFRDSLVKRSSPRDGVSEEISLIHEIEDIIDELHLILRIFESQRDVVKQFTSVFWPADKDKSYRGAFMDDCGLQGLIERTKALVRHAQRTRADLNSLVQMKQAQSSLEQAESASRLNNYILLFTLIAIIFTPLSFMTSLFAIPFDYFPQNSEGEIRVPGRWIARHMIIGEFSSLIAIVIIGFSIYAIRLPPWLLSGDFLHRKREERSSPNDVATTGHSSAHDRIDTTRLNIRPFRFRAAMDRRPETQTDPESLLLDDNDEWTTV